MTKKNVQNVMSMILEGATSQVQVHVSYMYVKIVDTLISSSIQILEKHFSFNRQTYIERWGESKTLIGFTIY